MRHVGFPRGGTRSARLRQTAQAVIREPPWVHHFVSPCRRHGLGWRFPQHASKPRRGPVAAPRSQSHTCKGVGLVQRRGTHREHVPGALQLLRRGPRLRRGGRPLQRPDGLQRHREPPTSRCAAVRRRHPLLLEQQDAQHLGWGRRFRGMPQATDWIAVVHEQEYWRRSGRATWSVMAHRNGVRTRPQARAVLAGARPYESASYFRQGTSWSYPAVPHIVSRPVTKGCRPFTMLPSGLQPPAPPSTPSPRLPRTSTSTSPLGSCPIRSVILTLTRSLRPQSTRHCSNTDVVVGVTVEPSGGSGQRAEMRGMILSFILSTDTGGTCLMEGMCMKH